MAYFYAILNSKTLQHYSVMEVDSFIVEALAGACITAISALIGFMFKTSRSITRLETLMKDHLEESKTKDEQLDKVRLRLERMLGRQEGLDAQK